MRLTDVEILALIMDGLEHYCSVQEYYRMNSTSNDDLRAIAAEIAPVVRAVFARYNVRIDEADAD